MPARKKKVTVLLTVSVPKDMSAADTRREIRTLINHQCNYRADETDVRVAGIRPIARTGAAP